MPTRCHLFCSVSDLTWGETLHAIRIALALHSRGDRIVFLAPARLAVLFEKLPFTYGRFENTSQLARALRLVVKEQGCTSIVLVDIALVYMRLEQLGADATFLEDLAPAGVPVLGLDMWDLPSSTLAWDFGPNGWKLSPHCTQVTRRLVPVPFVRPSANATYNALPELDDEEPRDAVRAELGFGADDRVVYFPTAAWQQTVATLPYNRRLASTFTPVIASLCAALDKNVHVLHVGGEDLHELRASLGDRYRRMPQLDEKAFRRLLRASDALLSFNAAASTIATALVADVPIVVGTCSIGGATADEILGRLAAPHPAIVEWVRAMVPLYPFKMWPLGMHGLLTPILEDNPYAGVLDLVEVLELDRLRDRLETALRDETARTAILERQRAYVAEVRQLPTATDLVDRYLNA